MPEHLRALIVILTLTWLIFFLMRSSALEFTPKDTFNRRRNIWFVLTIIAFLTNEFWLYITISSLILIVAATLEKNNIALYITLLFAVPAVSAEVPGFGLVNYLITIDHVRLLAITVLLPAMVQLHVRENQQNFGHNITEKFLIIYIALSVILELRDTSITDSLRRSLYIFTDMFLPYYVASRHLKDLKSIKESLMAFVLAGTILAVLGIFEISKNWLLYKDLITGMGAEWGYTGYLSRSDFLRASATTGHPIALGFVITVSIGFYLFLNKNSPSQLHRAIIGTLLAAGLFASLSRGPWVGTSALLLTYIIMGRNALRRIATLAIFATLSLPILYIIPFGRRLIDILPFVGTIETSNIDYRVNLIDNAISVIMRHPWFGSSDYLKTPELQSMVQGEGIIDLVNTYIGITLETGLLGLMLFVGIFVSTITTIRKSIRQLPNKESEEFQLGRSLIATIIGILVTISTVSSITIIPMVYWSTAGICAAFIKATQHASLNSKDNARIT